MNETNTPLSLDNDGYEIDLLRLVRRRWQLIVFGLLVTTIAAIAYQLNARPMFQSEMVILVAQRSSELTTSGTSSSGGMDSTLHDDLLATHTELLRSPRILNEAIRSGELEKLESFQEARRNGIPALSFLVSTFEVEAGGDEGAKAASVLRVTYNNPIPDDAKHVLDIVYDRYRNYVESQIGNSGDEAASLINQAQQINESDLWKATDAYQKFVATSAGLLDGDNLKSVPHERLKSIESELTEIRSSLAYARSRLELIDDMSRRDNASELTDIERLALLSAKDIDRLHLFMDVSRGDVNTEQFQVDQPLRAAAVNTEYDELLSLILREKALTADFGDDHPLVDRVRNDIAAVKQFIREKTPEDFNESEVKKMSPKQMLEAFVALLTNDINELTKRQKHLNDEAATVRLEAKAIESEYLAGKAIKARMDRAQQRYDEVMKRLQEIQLASDYAGFSTDLLSAPMRGEQSWPKALVVVALGCFAGLVLGGGMALVADYADQTFRDPTDLQCSLGANVIAHVPRFEITRKEKKAAKLSGLAPICRTILAPHSVESEVLRMARTSLFLSASQSHSKVFLVTSPMPGDGKSTMVVNIAASAAKAGKRVLLIDADLRKPTLHKLLGVRNENGLAEYLMGDCEFEEAINSTKIDGLNFIEHGHHANAPAELLESFGLERLIADARQEYDLVFLDSPPLLAVADPLIIAAQVDAALLVVRVQKNGRRPVERSRELLKTNSVILAGVIVNGSADGSKRFGYGEYVKPYEYGYATEYTKSYSSESTDRREPVAT